MSATSKTVSHSGNPDIDALLEGSAWNTGNLTYNFPAACWAGAAIYVLCVDQETPVLLRDRGHLPAH